MAWQLSGRLSYRNQCTQLLTNQRYHKEYMGHVSWQIILYKYYLTSTYVMIFLINTVYTVQYGFQYRYQDTSTEPSTDTYTVHCSVHVQYTLFSHIFKEQKHP